MTEGITSKIADFIEGFSLEGLEYELEEQVKKNFLDYLCVTITGSNTPVSKKLFSYINSSFTEQKATVLGYNKLTDLKNAAFINGTSAHALDFDDGHTKGSVHVGSVVFPAVLAVAEKNKNTSREILRSIVIGYEVTIKLASMVHPYSRGYGYHNTSIAGTFGAVAAISSLLKFNKEQIINALGIALSFTGGTFAFLHSGSDIKRLHPGIASSNGIVAIELSKYGISGPEKILERKFGFLDIFSNKQVNKQEVEELFNDSLEIFNVYIKAYPCCRQLDSSINAARKIRNKALKISLNEIKRIEVRTHYLAAEHNQKECNSLLDAQMSIPYAIAISLIDDVITTKSFDISRPQNKLIDDVKNKVEVYKEREFEKLYPPIRKSEVTIYTNDNEIFTAISDIPKGEPSNELSYETVCQKFKDNCKRFLSVSDAQEVIENVSNLNFLKAIDFKMRV